LSVGASRIAATMVALSLPTMVSAFISERSGFVRRIPKQVARAKAHMLKPATSGSIATIGCTPAQSPVGVKSVAIAEAPFICISAAGPKADFR
jgi:hypothetical protein